MRRKANAEESKCSINTKSVNKNQDESVSCQSVIELFSHAKRRVTQRKGKEAKENEKMENEKSVLYPEGVTY